MTASGHDQSPRNSLRGRHAGPIPATLFSLLPALAPPRLELVTPVTVRRLCIRSTRGTGDWHVYTAVFDQRKSEIYVDGYCEASGKNVGANCLDGLSIGCAASRRGRRPSRMQSRQRACASATPTRWACGCARCDHTGVFFLTGMIAELRLFSCHLPTAQRVQTEAALARRYSLSYSCAPTLPTPQKGLGRFNCAPRSAARTSDAY